MLLILLKDGDTKVNPGPNNKICSNLSIFHWNLNSLTAHDFSKVSLLQVYNIIHKYDIICLSETYLFSSILLDDNAVLFHGYELVKSDHPHNIKRGGFCIYPKETPSICFIDVPTLFNPIRHGLF